MASTPPDANDRAGIASAARVAGLEPDWSAPEAAAVRPAQLVIPALDRLWRRGRDFLGSELAIIGGVRTWLSDRSLVAATPIWGALPVSPPARKPPPPLPPPNPAPPPPPPPRCRPTP